MEDQSRNRPTNLIYGANLISRYLRFCLVPNGFAYNFEPGPSYKPKALPIGVALMCLMPLPSLGLINMLKDMLLAKVDKQSYEYKAITGSTFILRLAQILSFYRVVVVAINLFVSLNQHGRISSVMATKSNYLSEREQSRFAKSAFVFFCLNSLANTLAYAVVIIFILREEFKSRPLYYLYFIAVSAFMFWVRLTNCATLMYTCYVSVCLGQHVKNFSAIHIDSMFDQFMNSIETGEVESSPRSERFSDKTRTRAKPLVPHIDRSHRFDNHLEARQGVTRLWNDSLIVVNHLVASAIWALWTIRGLATRLCVSRYPEMPEMEMSKLSSTAEIHISESARQANNLQIRSRIRRTQTMISNMRDLVSDINKVSSPIIIVYILFETMLLIFIITTSVQAKVFRSLNILILPSLSITVSVASSVVCVCIFCDEATKQLKLLTNKLFDFIIMNHRAKSSDRQQMARCRWNSEEFCRLLSSESVSLNETWAQFQYTRKLADTIQFTMGGIFPVTRRLVLSVLGHVLSATFISIEIMSIVDTMNMPKTAKRAGQFNATHHHHHHYHYHNLLYLHPLNQSHIS